MSDYVKLHVDVLDNRKIQTLPDYLVRPWVNFLLLSRKNGGFLPDISDMAYRLRVDPAKLSAWIKEFENRGLLDRIGDAGHLQMHDWEDWNPSSPKDVTNAQRQARWREKQKLSRIPSPTPSSLKEIQDNVIQSNVSVTSLRNACAVTPLRNAVTDWPLTAIAIRKDFPTTDDGMILSIVHSATQSYISNHNGSGVDKPLRDDQIAGAVAAAKFQTQNSAGPYRKNVAQVIASWVKEKNHGKSA